MNVNVQITPSAHLQEMLARGVDVAPALRAAGIEVANYLRRYHANFGSAWRGYHYMPPSLGFAEQVVKGWQDPIVSGNTVTITNTFGLLKHKVTGGPITPQRSAYLTIPLVSEAKGKSVAEFKATSGEPLFRAGMALCQRLGGKVTAIYALSKGLTQPPWPGALPPDEAISLVFTTAIRDQLGRTLGLAA